MRSRPRGRRGVEALAEEEPAAGIFPQKKEGIPSPPRYWEVTRSMITR